MKLVSSFSSIDISPHFSSPEPKARVSFFNQIRTLFAVVVVVVVVVVVNFLQFFCLLFQKHWTHFKHQI